MEYLIYPFITRNGVWESRNLWTPETVNEIRAISQTSKTALAPQEEESV